MERMEKAFDCHCHLYDACFDQNRAQIIEQAKRVLWGVLVVGEDPKTNRKIADLAKKYEGFWHNGFGIHPEFAHKISQTELEDELIWISKQRPVCIGEVGLDKFWIKKILKPSEANSAWKCQLKIFKQFISLAKELDIPLNIHSRWATKEVLEILFEEKPDKVLLHAFPGTLTEAQKAVDKGYFISIGTSLIYSKQKQDLAKHLRLENIVLETDSPVMSPIKGQKNVPANISYVIECLAKIKNVTKEKIIEITNKNVASLFKL
ncbi:MAG: TatD family hydrolase [Candidatus Nanoarchaeia archaeon]